MSGPGHTGPGAPTSEFEPIGSYGMLSDCSSAALVRRTGSIDWLCLPRFDSPAVFAHLLDPRAGHWSIRPSGPFEMERRYLPGTSVLETTFRTTTGALRLDRAPPLPCGALRRTSIRPAG